MRRINSRLFAGIIGGALISANSALATGFAPISATISGGCIASGCVASGSNNGSANVTSSSTTVDIPIGSLVFFVASIRANANFTCSDTATGGSNTYTTVSVNNTSGQGTTSCWSVTTRDLPIGSTFTGTQASTSAKGILVAAFSGAASSPLDAASPAGTSGASADPSVGPSGTWTCPGGSNCSLQIGLYSTSVTLSVSTESAGFTPLGSETATTSGSLHFAYQIVSVTTATTYAPVNATSGNWAAQLRGFKAALLSNTNRLMFQSIP